MFGSYHDPVEREVPKSRRGLLLIYTSQGEVSEVRPGRGTSLWDGRGRRSEGRGMDVRDEFMGRRSLGGLGVVSTLPGGDSSPRNRQTKRVLELKGWTVWVRKVILVGLRNTW